MQPFQATSSSHQPHQTRKSDSVSNQFLTDSRKLENVSVARISIHSLQLANSIEFEEDFFGKKSFTRKKKERGRLAKPPMSASQGDPQNTGYFILYSVCCNKLKKNNNEPEFLNSETLLAALGP